MLLSTDCEDNFIQMPLITTHWCSPPEAIGIFPPEFFGPLPHRFMADLNAAGISSTIRKLSGNR